MSGAWYGSAYGYGDGSGDAGYGSGDAGSGSGSGSGAGSGSGSRSWSRSGAGFGNGSGNGSGSGSRSGDGSGEADEDITHCLIDKTLLTHIPLQLALMLELVHVLEVRRHLNHIIIDVKAGSHYDMLIAAFPAAFYDIYTDVLTMELGHA